MHAWILHLGGPGNQTYYPDVTSAVLYQLSLQRTADNSLAAASWRYYTHRNRLHVSARQVPVQRADWLAHGVPGSVVDPCACCLLSTALAGACVDAHNVDYTVTTVVQRLAL